MRISQTYFTSLVLVCLFISSFASAQQVSDERYVMPFAGNEIAPIGRVGVYRVDPAAISWGGAGRIREGRVIVRPEAGPDYDANANKLRRSGVLEVKDLAGFSGQAFGAQWDYTYAVLQRARELLPNISEDERSPLNWSTTDQAVFELGRRGIAQLEDFRRVEALIADIGWKGIERAFLERVRGSRPVNLPPLPNTWMEMEQAMADGRYSPEIRAALMLGPSALVTLNEMEAELQAELKSAGLESSAGLTEWVNWLRRAYTVLNEDMSRNLSGYSETINDKQIQHEGLLPGMPRERSIPGRWPQTDYQVVYSYNLSSLRTLEVLRGSLKPYAFKSAWLISQIKRHAAKVLATKLVALSISGNLRPDHFDGGTPEGGLLTTANLDDLLSLILVTDQLPEEIRRLFSESDAEAGSATASEAMKASAKAKREVAELLNKALQRFLDLEASRPVGELIEGIRSSPEKLSETIPNAKKELRGLATEHLATLEAFRAHASEMRGKITWLIEVIRDQDRRALKEELARTHDVDRDGQLSPEENEAFAAHFFALMDTGYLRKLARDGYVEIAAPNGRGTYRFVGEQDNDGRLYDFQNSVDTRGLSIEIIPAEERDLLLELEAGASYRFTFRYLSHGLDRQQSYVRFVPLDESGNELYEMKSSSNTVEDEVEEGKFIPFSFAKNRTSTEMQSGLYTGDTRDANGELMWREVSFLMKDVPASVAGLTFQIKLDRVTGSGSVYYRDFHLEKLEDYFLEDFEPERSPVTGRVIPEQPLSVTGVPPLWQRTLDMSRGFTAHSQLRYNDVIVPGAASGEPVGRSLEIRPEGGNVRLLSRRWFPMRSDRSYHFTGKLRTENMGRKQAWFEIFLYDENRRPVTIDGVLTTMGENVIRTPVRGSNPVSIGWRGVRTNSPYFIEESLRLDDLRRKDLAEGYNTQVDSKRARFAIAFAQLAVVVEGPDPDYDARVYVDEIQLKEEPRVRLTLIKLYYDDDDDIPDDFVSLGHPVAILEKEERGRRFELGIKLDVEGLAPNRSGFTYDFVLRDALGNVVPAASVLGADNPDRTIESDSNGSLRSADLPRVMLDDLPNLANRMGFFSAQFTLRYLGNPNSKSEPIVDREFRIGFLPPSLLPNSRSGEFGVVMDRGSNKMRRVYDSLRQLRISELAIPLYAPETELDPAAYDSQSYVEEFRLLADSLPDVRIVGMLGPTPSALNKLYPEDGAAAVYADGSRTEWPALLERTIKVWTDHVERMTFGAASDPSFGEFSSDSARALDNIHNALNQAGFEWAPREIPVKLRLGGNQQNALAVTLQSFQERWPGVLAATSPAIMNSMNARMTPDEAQKLRDARPRRIWLRDKEHFSFYVPAELSSAEMERAINEYLGNISRFEDALGDDAATALANARLVLNGNADQVDFDSLAGGRNTPAAHSLVFQLKTVDGLDTSYSDQLRDMTEKIVAAKRMGFTRILVDRLRDSGDMPNGLLSRDNSAQPAFFAFRTLNSVLSHREPVQRQLRLSSGASHGFFKDPDSGELTLIMFPGDKDIREQVALGKNARRIDLMGNDYPLDAVMAEIPTRAGDVVRAATGEVNINLPAGGLPVIITGIDTALMDTLLALKLDNESFDATETRQPRTLTVTNTFGEPTTFSVSVPFSIAQGNRDNIAAHARFIDDKGRELLLGAGKLSFESIELQPGETKDFTFSVIPRSTMHTGESVLPVRLTILGRENYEVLHRMPVKVDPLVWVDSAAIAAPPELKVYQFVLDVRSRSPLTNTMEATISIDGDPELGPYYKTFNVPANGASQGIVSIPRYPRGRLVGRRVVISLRQSPGALFDNREYTIEEEEGSGTLLLKPRVLE